MTPHPGVGSTPGRCSASSASTAASPLTMLLLPPLMTPAPHTVAPPLPPLLPPPTAGSHRLTPPHAAAPPLTALHYRSCPPTLRTCTTLTTPQLPPPAPAPASASQGVPSGVPGRAVQLHNIKIRVESAFGFSAYIILDARTRI